ncbi:MAG: TrkH family potassium uptake protein, partial [Candidatus Altiarchaeales archaeon]|nr:TrkH family potassium uptake protein [Candidatus Altiarchaeales archaeon]
SLIFKRTFSEWVGGLGIVIIFLSLLAKGGISTVYMYRIQEGNKVLAPTVEHTARIILRVYLFYTVCGAILLCILENMDPFYALTGVMSNISTGGFIGVVFGGSGFEISWMGECVLMAAMILGAVPFIMHDALLSGRLRRFLGNIEIKTLFLILFLSVLLFIGLLWNSELYLFSAPLKFEKDFGGGVISDDLGNIFRTNGEALSGNATIKKVDGGWTIVDGGKAYSIRRESEKLDVYYADNKRVIYNSVLGTISALTTTGYSGGGLELIGDMGKIILIVLMVIGAGAGSTGGGMKLIRFCVLIGGVRWLLKKYSLPESAVVPLRVGGRIFHDNEVRTIALFFFIYSVLQVLGCAVLVFCGVTPIDALLTSASAQATGSITTIDVGEDLNIVAKVMLIVQMIAGRLEIFPLLTLIGYFIHKAEREVVIVEHEAERKMKLKGKEMELKKRIKFIRRLGKIE